MLYSASRSFWNEIRIPSFSAANRQNHHNNAMRLTILLMGLSLLVGCATTEPLPSYFVLTAPGGTAKSARPATAVRVYVRRVEVPAFLNRTNLASMHGDQ